MNSYKFVSTGKRPFSLAKFTEDFHDDGGAWRIIATRKTSILVVYDGFLLDAINYGIPICGYRRLRGATFYRAFPTLEEARNELTRLHRPHHRHEKDMLAVPGDLTTLRGVVRVYYSSKNE